MIKKRCNIATFVAIMMILMCCPLVALAANTTEEATTETATTEEENFSEEDESFKEILEELFDAFERSYGIKLSCNISESKEDLVKEFEVPDKDNEVILWTVRNENFFKVTSSSNVSIEGLTDVLEKVESEEKEWGDWIAELAIEMTSFDYKVREPSIKKTVLNSAEKLLWIVVLLAILHFVFNVVKSFMELFMAREKGTKNSVIRKSRKIRKAEEWADLLEIEVRKKTAELELCKLHKEIEKYEPTLEEKNPKESDTHESNPEESTSEKT